MLFTIHIDINGHRIGGQCIVFLGDIQIHEPLLLNSLKHFFAVKAHVSCNPTNLSVVLSVRVCPALQPRCEYVSLCLLYCCLPALWLLSAPNFVHLFRQTVGLDALFGLSVLSWTALCCEGFSFLFLWGFFSLFPWATTHFMHSLWKPWGQWAVFIYLFIFLQCCTAVYLDSSELCACLHIHVCLSEYCRHHTSLYQVHYLQIRRWVKQMSKAIRKE